MADIGFWVFIVVLLAGGSVLLVRAAWLHWTDPERAPDVTLSSSASWSVRRGHERGVVPFAGWLVCMTIGIAALGTGSEVVPGLFVLGSMPLLMLHATITWFNRPRFLVPPHRRGETGSVVEWWRERRERRARLRKAAWVEFPGRRPGPR